MGVLKVKELNSVGIFILFLIAMLSILSLCAYAEIPPYKTVYDEDFIEGESLTASFEALDTLEFDYYGEEYSFRVLGVYSESVYVRADSTAIEIMMWETHPFDIDDEDGYDLNVTLRDVDDDEKATLKFELNLKPEPEPEINETNTTTTDTNTTNTTSTNTTDDGSSDDEPEPEPEEEPEEEDGETEEEDEPEEDEDDATGPTGDVVYDINININIPPGGGFGTLIIVIIVLGGLFGYKKIRKRMKEKEEEAAHPGQKNLPEKPKGPSEFKRFKKSFGRKMKKARKWLGHKIAGEQPEKKKKR